MVPYNYKKTVPFTVGQHLSTHADLLNVPISVCSTTRKRRGHLFTLLQPHTLNRTPTFVHQLQLQPETVFIDYETATNNTARTVFPEVTVKAASSILPSVFGERHRNVLTTLLLRHFYK